MWRIQTLASITFWNYTLFCYSKLAGMTRMADTEVDGARHAEMGKLDAVESGSCCTVTMKTTRYLAVDEK